MGEVCLEVKHYSNKKINDINFSLRKGEIVGFAGPVGAGRTELARAIFGIDKVDSGELYINGELVNIQKYTGCDQAWHRVCS